MLNNISKLLTGDVLKVLCDMGHGEEIILADGNFPAVSHAKNIIRLPGMNVSDVLEAISPIFPLDVAYTEHPACVMELTPGDKAKGMAAPEAWKDYERILHKQYPSLVLGNIERYSFYERTEKAYAVLLTGEDRLYGNLLLVKGCVL